MLVSLHPFIARAAGRLLADKDSELNDAQLIRVTTLALTSDRGEEDNISPSTQILPAI